MNFKFGRTSWENEVNFIQLYDTLCIDVKTEVRIYARTKLHYENPLFPLSFGHQMLSLHILSLSQPNHSSNKMKHRKCYLFGIFQELYPNLIPLKKLKMYLMLDEIPINYTENVASGAIYNIQTKNIKAINK